MSLANQGNLLPGPQNRHYPLPNNPALNSRRTSGGMTYEQIVILINLIWDVHEQLDLQTPTRFVGYPVGQMKALHQPIYEMLVNMALSIEASYTASVSGKPDVAIAP